MTQYMVSEFSNAVKEGKDLTVLFLDLLNTCAAERENIAKLSGEKSDDFGVRRDLDESNERPNAWTILLKNSFLTEYCINYFISATWNRNKQFSEQQTENTPKFSNFLTF